MSAQKDNSYKNETPQFSYDSHLRNWRAWGSWFSWGSPVGLGLLLVCIGVFLWLLHLAGLIGN